MTCAGASSISGVLPGGGSFLLNNVLLNEYPLSRPAPGDLGSDLAPGVTPGDSDPPDHGGNGVVFARSSGVLCTSARRGDGSFLNGAPCMLCVFTARCLSVPLRFVVPVSPSAFASIALPLMVHRHQRMRVVWVSMCLHNCPPHVCCRVPCFWMVIASTQNKQYIYLPWCSSVVV